MKKRVIICVALAAIMAMSTALPMFASQGRNYNFAVNGYNWSAPVYQWKTDKLPADVYVNGSYVGNQIYYSHFNLSGNRIGPATTGISYGKFRVGYYYPQYCNAMGVYLYGHGYGFAANSGSYGVWYP